MTGENYKYSHKPPFPSQSVQSERKTADSGYSKFQIQWDDFDDLLLIVIKSTRMIQSISTVWSISFCMITNLNAYGKIQIVIWKN